MDYIEQLNLPSFTTNLLITEEPLSYLISTSGISQSYYNNVYDNIHVIENKFNFGYVTSPINYYFEVWNTFSVNKSLDEINFGSITGVNINDNDGTPLSIPRILPAKMSHIYQLNVTTNGAKEAVGNINLVISGISVPIYVSLTRSFIFDYQLNMANNIEESYKYTTEIIESVDSTETRRSYIKNPRFNTTYFYTVENKERRMLDKVLYSASNDVIVVPLYIYARLISNINLSVITVDTANTPLQVGMQVMIKDDNKYDSAVIVSLNSTSITVDKEIANDFVYPVLYPLVNSRLEMQTVVQSITNYAATYTINFIKEVDNISMSVTNNSTSIKMFNSLPLLDVQQNKIDPSEITFYRNVVKIDDGISKPQFKINNTINKIQTSFDFILETKQKINELKNFFNNVKGMYKDFYFLSNKQDFVVVENISSSSIIITVENENIATYYKDKYIKYAAIFYGDTYKIVTINDMYAVNADKENLVLSAPFGINLNKNNILSCQFIYRSRFSSDVLDISYDTDDVAEVNLSILKINKE